MATQAYYDWVRAGRPWAKAYPVEGYRALLVAAGFAANNVGTIGDEAHLTADRPQDHTPFSVTGWPRGNPHPYVHALDLSGKSRTGMDWTTVVEYWIREAEAGRTPWVKYIIYRGQRWDVRNNWIPVWAQGHFGHGHVSFRTDWTLSGIGDWYPLPYKEDDMSAAAEEHILYGAWRLLALINLEEQIPGGPEGGNDVPAVIAIKQIAEDIEAVERQLLGLKTPTIDPLAFANALAANERFVDAVSTAVAAKVGMIPTAREVAREVGKLTWHGVGE